MLGTSPVRRVLAPTIDVLLRACPTLHEEANRYRQALTCIAEARNYPSVLWLSEQEAKSMSLQLKDHNRQQCGVDVPESLRQSERSRNCLFNVAEFTQPQRLIHCLLEHRTRRLQGEESGPGDLVLTNIAVSLGFHYNLFPEYVHHTTALCGPMSRDMHAQVEAFSLTETTIHGGQWCTEIEALAYIACVPKGSAARPFHVPRLRGTSTSINYARDQESRDLMHLRSRAHLHDAALGVGFTSPSTPLLLYNLCDLVPLAETTAIGSPATVHFNAVGWPLPRSTWPRLEAATVTREYKTRRWFALDSVAEAVLASVHPTSVDEARSKARADIRRQLLDAVAVADRIVVDSGDSLDDSSDCIAINEGVAENCWESTQLEAARRANLDLSWAKHHLLPPRDKAHPLFRRQGSRLFTYSRERSRRGKLQDKVVVVASQLKKSTEGEPVTAF